VGFRIFHSKERYDFYGKLSPVSVVKNSRKYSSGGRDKKYVNALCKETCHSEDLERLLHEDRL
jgi:hypothetical protein